MAQYRDHLPQLDGAFFLTDGGIETTLIFHEGLDLPYFAAFVLLRDGEGYAALQRYFRTYADLARRYGAGFILESATWRANPDWADKLGYSTDELAAANRRAPSLSAAAPRQPAACQERPDPVPAGLGASRAAHPVWR